MTSSSSFTSCVHVSCLSTTDLIARVLSPVLENSGSFTMSSRCSQWMLHNNQRKFHYTILTIDSSTDSWFLESMVKMMQLHFLWSQFISVLCVIFCMWERTGSFIPRLCMIFSFYWERTGFVWFVSWNTRDTLLPRYQHQSLHLTFLSSCYLYSYYILQNETVWASRVHYSIWYIICCIIVYYMVRYSYCCPFTQYSVYGLILVIYRLILDIYRVNDWS
jgi:hypothetical protein